MCGEQRLRCMVCHQFLGQGEELSKCPYCKQLSHRAHLLEWLRVKGRCPSCEQKLRETEVA
jgi:hypothetical protein